MDIEKLQEINVEEIRDIESVKRVIKKLVDVIFVMEKDITRELNNLTSKNVKNIDFNVTRVENIHKPLKNYATKSYVITTILNYLGQNGG